MPTIKFNPGKLTPSVWVSANINGVTIKPGINELSEDAFVKLKGDRLYRRYIAMGVVEVEVTVAKAEDKPPAAKKNRHKRRSRISTTANTKPIVDTSSEAT